MGDQTDYLLDRYFGQDEDFYDEEPKTCFRCGRTGLAWLDTEHGWRLSEDGEKVHVCTPDVAHLFDVIEEEN